MGAYRDAVNADGVYVHFELNNNFSDSEGLVPTDGSTYGGSTHSTFSTPSFVKGGAGYHCDMGVGVDSGRFLSKVDADLASNLDNNDELSIELWYKPETLRTTGGQVNNLIRHDTNLWWLRSVNGYLQMLISTDLAGGIGHTDTTTQMSNGNVYHLVGTYDGADNKIRLYVNGSLVSTSPALTGNYLYFPTNTAWTYLGSPGTETMDGLVDEVALYRKVLSLAEIQDHYNIGVGNATVSATVTNIDVTGKAATVTATTDAIISATVTDIDIAGKPATVTATAPNATVNAVVTDVDIAGQPATVTAEIFVDVNAVVTDVDIAGVAATVNVEVTTTQNAVVTDIDVAGNAPTVVISVDAVVSDIDVLGYGPAVSAGGNIEIVFDVTDVDVTGKAATVTAEQNITVNAVVSDIDIAGKYVINLYPSLIFAKDPIHYWQFTLQGTEYLISDFGSETKNGSFTRYYGDGTTSNLDSASFIDGINSDFGSNGINTLNLVTGTSTTSYRDRVGFSGDQPTVIGDNLTYELWFKTGSSYAVFLTLDSPDYEPSSFNIRQNALGLINGKLSIWEMPANQTQWNQRANVITYDYAVNDDNWHHLMMTKSTSGGITTYKSYLDGSETPTTLSLGNLLNNAVKTTAYDYFTGSYTVDETDTLFYIGDAYGESWGGTAGTTYGVYLDDYAIYETALTQQDAIDRYGAGAGSESVSINAVVTDIDIAANATAKSAIINISRTDIDVKGNNPQFSAGGFVTVGSVAPNVGISATPPSIAIDGSISIGVSRTSVSVDGQNVFSQTRDAEIRFIPADDQSMSALDAEEISSLDFGGLLYNQSKVLLFKIGNESTNICTLNVRIGSISTDVLPAVRISYDGYTYQDSLTIESVPANGVTEVIYVKIDVNQLPFLGNGSFILDVEQTLYA